MGRLFRKFGHLIAGALIVWYAHSALDTGGSKLKEKIKLPRISTSAMPLRAEDEAPLEGGDPFQAMWSPYGPKYSPEAQAEKHRKMREEEKRKVIEARKRHREKRQETKEATPTFRPFTLLLESVLALPDGGVARISGHTLRVGDSIPGMDDDKPPVLVSVKGSVAEVAYRGARYALHITGKRSQRVTERPDAPKVQSPPAPEPEDAAVGEAPGQPAGSPDKAPETG